MKAIQYIDSFDTEAQAIDAFDSFFKTQSDYIGGRILPPHSAKTPKWRAQVFFDANGADPFWLPDGCLEVTIPDGQKHALGITVK